MKRFLTILAMLPMQAVAVVAVNAAETCVWDGRDAPFTNCRDKIGNEYGKADWGATCNVDHAGPNKDVTFRGVATFGSCNDLSKNTSAGSACDADKMNALSNGSQIDSSSFCWCKLVSPIVSKWILLDTTTHTSYYCGMMCLSAFTSSADYTFHTAFFNNLAD